MRVPSCKLRKEERADGGPVLGVCATQNVRAVLIILKPCLLHIAHLSTLSLELSSKFTCRQPKYTCSRLICRYSPAPQPLPDPLSPSFPDALQGLPSHVWPKPSPGTAFFPFLSGARSLPCSCLRPPPAPRWGFSADSAVSPSSGFLSHTVSSLSLLPCVRLCLDTPVRL